MNFNPNSEVDLRPLETAFRAARSTVRSRTYDVVPDGTYQVSIEDVTLGYAPVSGSPSLKWMLRILGPTEQRRVLFKWNAITERSLPYLLDELDLCGIELDKIADLEGHLPSLVGMQLEVVKRTKGERANVYINKALTKPVHYEVIDESLPF
ncbi:MAG: hypothetical protein NW208_10135 [Bryobacter sp.]|nr:hypothetical protein [Bryobacter sp.]